MKVMIAVHHFPPRYTGGAEWRAYRTAAALIARGHQASVVAIERIDAAPGDGLTWSDEVYEGVPVRRLSFNLAASPDPFAWQYNNPWIGEHLDAFIAQERPDAFHLIGGYLMTGSAILSARRAGLPVVVSLTDYWFLCPRISMLRSDGSISTLPIDSARCARCLGEEQRRFRLPGKLLPGLMDAYWRAQTGQARQIETRREFLLAALNQADAVICPSRFLRSLYLEAGLDPARAHFSRQGRDFPGLETGRVEKSAGDVLRVGYLGQIASHKGVHVLIEAVRLLRDIPMRLAIYGNLNHYPEYARKLVRLAATDERIELRGEYPRQELSRVMDDLDLIVVPSLWYENSPNTILEAFAHRTPVIASDLGGMSELVEEGKNGLLFRAGNAKHLAEQVLRCAADPGLLERLRAGIEPVKSVTQEMDELVELYAGLAPQPTRSY